MWCGFFSQKKYPSRIFKRLSQHETFQNIPYFCALIHRNRNSRVLRSKRHFLNKLLSRRGRSVWGGFPSLPEQSLKILSIFEDFLQQVCDYDIRTAMSNDALKKGFGLSKFHRFHAWNYMKQLSFPLGLSLPVEGWTNRQDAIYQLRIGLKRHSNRVSLSHADTTQRHASLAR